MGLLRMVLSLFRRIEPDRETERSVVSLDGLDSWLTVQIAEVIAKYDLVSGFKVYFSELQGRRRILSAQFSAWQAKLDELPVEKQRELQPLFEDVAYFLTFLSLPESISVASYGKYDKQIEERLNELLSKVEQSWFVSSYAFLYDGTSGNRQPLVNPLLQELLSINALHSRFSETLRKSGFRRLELLRSRVSHIVALWSSYKDLERECTEKVKRLEQLREKVAEKKGYITARQEEPSSEYDVLLQKKESLILQEESIAMEVELLFNAVHDVLLAYTKEHGEKVLVEPYLDHCVDAFKADEGLHILHILSHCRALLMAEKLLVSNPTAILAALDNCLDSLEHLHGRFLTLHKEHEVVKNNLFRLGKSQKISEASYKLDHFTQQLEKLEEELADFNDQMEEKQEELVKEKELFENMVRIGLHRRLSVVMK